MPVHRSDPIRPFLPFTAPSITLNLIPPIMKHAANRTASGPRHACWYAFNEKLLIRLLLERSFAAEMKGIGRLQRKKERKKDAKARVYWAPPVIIFIESGVSGESSLARIGEPDFNPAWQWRDADTKIRTNNPVVPHPFVEQPLELA